MDLFESCSTTSYNIIKNLPVHLSLYFFKRTDKLANHRMEFVLQTFKGIEIILLLRHWMSHLKAHYKI